MASKRRLRRVEQSHQARDCPGKVRYIEEIDAHNHLVQLLSRPYCEAGHRLRVYKCSACSGFHVGRISPSLS